MELNIKHNIKHVSIIFSCDFLVLLQETKEERISDNIYTIVPSHPTYKDFCIFHSFTHTHTPTTPAILDCFYRTSMPETRQLTRNVHGIFYLIFYFIILVFLYINMILYDHCYDYCFTMIFVLLF